MERLLFTVPEAAAILGMGRSHVYQLISSGQLASVKIGRSRRISERSIRQFVAEPTAA
jgi:excisionase family DNA binding protein